MGHDQHDDGYGMGCGGFVYEPVPSPTAGMITPGSAAFPRVTGPTDAAVDAASAARETRNMVDIHIDRDLTMDTTGQKGHNDKVNELCVEERARKAVRASGGV